MRRGDDEPEESDSEGSGLSDLSVKLDTELPPAVGTDPFQMGERIGKCLIERRLGSGGLGVVYAAVHEQMGWRVAIKALRPDKSEHVGRFIDEARASRMIDDAGIVKVDDYGQTPEGVHYIVMEYVTGHTLRAALNKARMDAVAAVHIVRQLAATLSSTHQKGIVHRDLTPNNVMLVGDARVPGGQRTKLLDFGLAKLPAEQRRAGVLSTRLSMPVGGTAGYMSPEQLRGDPITDRSDVFSLGATFYHMLVGQVLVAGAGMDVRRAFVEHVKVEPEARVTVDLEALASLVRRMLAPDPQLRPSMTDICKDLDALVNQRALPIDVSRMRYYHVHLRVTGSKGDCLKGRSLLVYHGSGVMESPAEQLEFKDRMVGERPILSVYFDPPETILNREHFSRNPRILEYRVAPRAESSRELHIKGEIATNSLITPARGGFGLHVPYTALIVTFVIDMSSIGFEPESPISAYLTIKDKQGRYERRADLVETSQVKRQTAQGDILQKIWFVSARNVPADSNIEFEWRA